jgi:hypothetical protein
MAVAPDSSLMKRLKRVFIGFLLGVAENYWFAVLSSVCTVLNVLVSSVPTRRTEAMIATARRAAIRPYSIAVAPDSSLMKRLKRVFMRVVPLLALFVP